MCMKNTEEGCELSSQLNELKGRVTKIEGRMEQVEHDVGKMRSETQDGFKQGAEAMRAINASVANLAHDFGERMTNLDRRIIEEKQKWGETLRSIVIWTVRLVLAGCAVAMGITAWRTVVQ